MDKLKKIFKGCKAGKSTAQKQLFDLYSRKMYGVALIYTQNKEDAEDVLQEGFIKIFQKIKELKKIEALEGWLRRIIINEALMLHRQHTHMYAINEINEYSQEFSYENIIAQITETDILKVIHELTPQYRIVFSLYAIEGYSHEEIAKQLNITSSTSKSNLSRARKILQEKLESTFLEKTNNRKKIITC